MNFQERVKASRSFERFYRKIVDRLKLDARPVSTVLLLTNSECHFLPDGLIGRLPESTFLHLFDKRDENPAPHPRVKGRAIVTTSDQSLTESTNGFRFDVVIDARSRPYGDTLRAFRILFPRTLPGGWYVIPNFSAGTQVSSPFSYEAVPADEIGTNLYLARQFVHELANAPDNIHRKAGDTIISELMVVENAMAVRKQSKE